MIGIEKDVPVTEVTGRGRACKYPWKGMQAGDSFFAAHRKTGDMNGLATQHFGKGNYAIRKEGNGVRVWRTA